jgi:hypothetical protein
MPATARRLIRKMRGGAQAHLIEADDGHFYVVKFRNNPQGRRILVNEWFGCLMLRYLGIACAEPAIVNIDGEFLREYPGAAIRLGQQAIPPEPGWHFGSRYPGDPDRLAVYDFIPDALLSKVENLHEYPAVLAFDKWAGNADARQSVFLRARVRDYAPAAHAHPLRVGFVTIMIDHGYLFNGPHWDFLDSAPAGMYFRPTVYHSVRGWDAFQPWLDRIVNFPEEVIDGALRELPPNWLNGDMDGLMRLLDRLMKRRRRVPELIEECRRSRLNPFPAWPRHSG